MTRLGSLTSATDTDAWTREKDRLAALGAIAFNEPYTPSSAVPASQFIFGGAVYLYAGETATNILVCVNTAGAGTAPTLIKLGLWSSAATPVCLAVTADLTADARWTSTGWKVNALTTPYVVPSSGIYYPAFLINGVFATTNILLAQAGVLGPAGNPIGSAARRWGSLKTAATSMAVADTGTYGQAGSVPLFGVS